MIIPVSTAVEATAADVFTMKVEHPMRIRDVGVIVSVLTAIDNTDCVASLDAIISGAARAEKGTMTITDAVAAGTQIVASEDFSSWASFDVDEGDTLIFEQKTAGVDASTEAGDYYFIIYYHYLGDGQA